MITIGTRLEESHISIDLARRYDQVDCAVGIHPHYAAEASLDEHAAVCALFADDHVIACGEMGLDYHYDFSPRDAQRRGFEMQLDAARKTGKPLVLHSRESVDDCLAILRSHGGFRGVFHCFTGTEDEARKILDGGYYLGFTGIITFKNTDYLREIIRFCPADRLLLETDAPYLSPEPMRRQKVNEPSLVRYTYQRAAELRQTALAELIQLVQDNANRLLSL
jgi:TatD DNase family protein